MWNKQEEDNYVRVSTWNMRSIKGKEDKLEEEIEHLGIDILGITEAEMKGRRMI